MSKKTYVVAEGHERISAGPVPENGRIELSEAEAAYDLSLGRIKPQRSKPPAKKAAEVSEE
ncbi:MULTISPECIES: hypothetical protein [unclassified Roseibium]|uniref:hypothetical protein n=1 Tax=unclassified Roseibium TaxID=2629323 RepID=UPI00273F659E|nr:MULTISPECIES: hypothetical protein [unclassified Roseibium]